MVFLKLCVGQKDEIDDLPDRLLASFFASFFLSLGLM